MIILKIDTLTCPIESEEILDNMLPELEAILAKYGGKGWYYDFETTED